MATKLKRHLWKCPLCGARYEIPVGHNPGCCPQCSTETVSQPESFSQTLKKRRSAVRWRWLTNFAVLIMVAVLGIVVTFLSGTFRVPKFIAKRIPVIDNDPDRNAVRAWLSKDLDNAKLEEVEWWPSCPLKGSLVWRPMSDLPPSYRERSRDDWWYSPGNTGRSIRLKYKLKYKLFGQPITKTYDQVFILDDLKVVIKEYDTIDFRLPNETVDQYITRFRSNRTIARELYRLRTEEEQRREKLASERKYYAELAEKYKVIIQQIHEKNSANSPESEIGPLRQQELKIRTELWRGYQSMERALNRDPPRDGRGMDMKDILEAMKKK